MSVIRSRAPARANPQAPEVEVTAMVSLAARIREFACDELVFFCIACCLWSGLGRVYEVVYSQCDFQRKKQITGANLKPLPSGGYHLALNHPKIKSPNGQSLILIPLPACYCPVKALAALQAARPLRSDQALWTLRDGSVADRAWFAASAQRLLGQTIDDSSFRAGGATHMVLNGVNPELVRKLGRWSSEAFDLYIRSRPSMLAACLRQQLTVTPTQSPFAAGHANANALAASILQLGDCFTRLAKAWEDTASGQSPAGRMTARNNS
jgi:hypothetical protein